MQIKPAILSHWNTAAMSGTADTSPMELSALGEHLGACRETNVRLFALRCAAESMSGFVSSRFVTSLLAIVILICVVALI